MVQLSFVDHVKAQGEAAVTRLCGILRAEADEQGGGFDYEGLDYLIGQVEQDEHWAREFFAPLVLVG